MRPCPQCGTACESSHQYCPGCGFPIGAVAVNSEDKLVGRSLPGGYLVLDLISVGGMGRVYRAEQRALGRTVAVKVIHPHLLADENSIVRFMTEARAASQLNHPNSVSVIDFGRTDDGQPYLVMEFLRGKDLARVAYDQGPLAFKRVVDVLVQTLMALSEAHDLGIVHRDLKPENIILEPLRRGGDFVKVVDFGLA
jgi:serine/threonine protein kinase